jgi:uncharacterized integral membrane protein (TIGR00697 family)
MTNIDSTVNYLSKTLNYANNPIITKRVTFLGMLFVSFLIIANVTASKVVECRLPTGLMINFPAALVFFPFTYFFDDVLTEVYGFKISRFIIWSGLICSALMTFCTWIVVQLPVSPTWDANTHHGNQAYTLVFQGSLRIFLASIMAYFFGEFINSALLAKLKLLTKGNYFSCRVMASTAVGVAIDTIIFCIIAFHGTMPKTIIWHIIVTQYLIKVCYEFFMLPITYTLVNYLKKTDNIDYYDIDTNFTPFSFKLTN